MILFSRNDTRLQVAHMHALLSKETAKFGTSIAMAKRLDKVRNATVLCPFPSRWHKACRMEHPLPRRTQMHGLDRNGDQYASEVFTRCQKMRCLTAANSNKTVELSQRTPRDAPNIWVPWKVLRVLTTHPATFPEICNGLLFRSIPRMCVQKLKFVALPVPEIIEGTQKIWAVPGYAHAPFFPKILKGFCSDGPCEYICRIWIS